MLPLARELACAWEAIGGGAWVLTQAHVPLYIVKIFLLGHCNVAPFAYSLQDGAPE
jgi:hypothetical protein